MENRTTTAEVLLSKSFLLAFFSFFFLWISFDFFILFPLFILSKGGNSVDVGIQTAIFFLPSVMIRPIAGWLTDRLGRLKVLWFGSFLMVLTAFSFLLLQGDYDAVKVWMACILLLRGTAFASFYVAFFTYVVDLSSKENRARVIGLFGVSGLVAHGLAPWIAEQVLHQFSFFGYFIVSGSLSMLSLMISAALKEDRVIPEMREKGFDVLKKVTFTTRNMIILPGAFVFGVVVASFNTFGAPYFQEAGKASVGHFFLAYGLTAGAVRILFGGIADRYERWKLVSIFFALQGLGVIFLVVKPVHDFYLIAGSISGAAHGILFPSLTAMAIDAHPQEFRGVVTSIFTGTIELGFSLGSYVQGVIVDVAGYVSMFVATSILGLMFTAYVVILKMTRRKPQVV